MNNARFTYTIVYVPDVERTISFYEAGFGVKRRFVADDGSYGELQTGDVTLSFASEALGEKNLDGDFARHRPNNAPFAYELAFTTEDVEALIAQSLAAGATLVAAAVEKPWGQTVAYVRDPDGILIEICTPMGS